MVSIPGQDGPGGSGRKSQGLRADPRHRASRGCRFGQAVRAGPASQALRCCRADRHCQPRRVVQGVREVRHVRARRGDRRGRAGRVAERRGHRVVRAVRESRGVQGVRWVRAGRPRRVVRFRRGCRSRREVHRGHEGRGVRGGQAEPRRGTGAGWAGGHRWAGHRCRGHRARHPHPVVRRCRHRRVGRAVRAVPAGRCSTGQPVARLEAGPGGRPPWPRRSGAQPSPSTCRGLGSCSTPHRRGRWPGGSGRTGRRAGR